MPSGPPIRRRYLAFSTRAIAERFDVSKLERRGS
jgi:hypothetical protein